ncbi:hypothetical protein [Phenylobacterium sp. SCN 70-31]|uniref:hypothetical protein n=1 Tax=Phenylobacterium sp. SCN 70-31 TaxID=1660129 RepID=UPI00086DBA6E|nr:hypothetical protein [Phenylobacterium sp. SCN 70-31]ODT84840.1 MAG: hypothetical protein ABS78_22040 [Phenylobacterium sp. SCN 70-31]
MKTTQPRSDTNGFIDAFVEFKKQFGPIDQIDTEAKAYAAHHFLTGLLAERKVDPQDRSTVQRMIEMVAARRRELRPKPITLTELKSGDQSHGAHFRTVFTAMVRRALGDDTYLRLRKEANDIAEMMAKGEA